MMYRIGKSRILTRQYHGELRSRNKLVKRFNVSDYLAITSFSRSKLLDTDPRFLSSLYGPLASGKERENHHKMVFPFLA